MQWSTTRPIRQSSTGIPLRPVIFQASDTVLPYRKVGTSYYMLPVVMYVHMYLPVKDPRSYPGYREPLNQWASLRRTHAAA